MHSPELKGAGLGFRRELIPALKTQVPAIIDFFEIAPGKLDRPRRRDWQSFAQFHRTPYPFVCHGLSLSLGGPAALDEVLLHRIKSFMRQHQIRVYTEHLSYCSDHGQLYDLLPIPFTEEAVKHVARRIRQTQEILGMQIAVENASYYVAAPISEMSEIEFIRAVLEEADCLLHLDVNNIYVNSVNFGFDAQAFLRALPGERISYIHTAGHYREADDLVIDTHGAAVIDPVWALLRADLPKLWRIPYPAGAGFQYSPAERVGRKEVTRIAELQQRHGHGSLAHRA